MFSPDQHIEARMRSLAANRGTLPKSDAVDAMRLRMLEERCDRIEGILLDGEFMRELTSSGDAPSKAA